MAKKRKVEEQLQSSLPSIEEAEAVTPPIAEPQATPAVDLTDLVAQLRTQILQELKASGITVPDPEEARKRQEREKMTYEEYVTTMKGSPNGWVDLQGISDSTKGVRIQLDWNDAFIAELRANGITGSDDEAVVQKWLALLSRDLDESGALEEEAPKSEYV